MHDSIEGMIRAAEEMAVENCQRFGPREAPLSGEYAGEPSAADILGLVGFYRVFTGCGPVEDVALDDVLTAYENAYSEH